MNRTDILAAINIEYKRAKKKSWPDHISAQVGMATKDAAKLTEMAIALKFSKQSEKNRTELKRQMERKAIKGIANAFRFLENLK